MFRPRDALFSSCKLWRNPEARREVVAQLFEYATLLSEWTYSDLEARLKKARRLTGENPIFAAARTAHPELEEAAFVDAVNQSLVRGGNNYVRLDLPGPVAGLVAYRSAPATAGLFVKFV